MSYIQIMAHKDGRLSAVVTLYKNEQRVHLEKTHDGKLQVSGICDVNSWHKTEVLFEKTYTSQLDAKRVAEEAWGIESREAQDDVPGGWYFSLESETYMTELGLPDDPNTYMTLSLPQ